nr:set1 complex component spp1 [Quercus suber]
MNSTSEREDSRAMDETVGEAAVSCSLTKAQSSNDNTSLALVNEPLRTMSSHPEGNSSSPLIKQEPSGLQTPQGSSPQHEMDNTNRAVSSLKNEHGLRTQSPLRESSIPVPSTEMSSNEQTVPAKRPAPAKTKKGTATSTKKAPAVKRRKLEQNRSATPSSRTLKTGNLKTGSNLGTPVKSSPTRSAGSSTGDSDGEDEDEDMSGGDVDDDNLYCICKKPDNGTFMIGCDGPCEDWFHGKCVNIQEKNKSLIDKFICPNCAEAGKGKTTFKRMCRRPGCRQPARTSRGKNNREISKYCSDECGVQYFRELAARARGQEEVAKSRSNRRKGNPDTLAEDFSEARGGTISAGELKAMLATSKSAEDFQRLGEGVLSPPATPDEKGNIADIEFTDTELSGIRHIDSQKEEARRRHQLQKDRLKFITMIKQSASRVTTEKELKPRDYCGYDSRLEWTPEQFATWRDSAAGKRAFEQDSVAVENSSSADDQEMADSVEAGLDAEQEVCDRKKCLRHLDWAKMMVDGLRAEMTENSDHMRALEQEGKSIRERAALRARCGEDASAAGTVEFHTDINQESDTIPSQAKLRQPQFDEITKLKAPDVGSVASPDALVDMPNKIEAAAGVDLVDKSIMPTSGPEPALPTATDAMDVDA